ncbi:MAG: hypothetical protein KF894_26780 [Labilithrix sp.]|nr:hypothetical protein [Labilithrix sp.]
MKDPRRLSAEAETTELVQSLLAAGRDRRAPDGARERVWASLGVGIAGGAATAGATGSAAATGATGTATATATATGATGTATATATGATGSAAATATGATGSAAATATGSAATAAKASVGIASGAATSTGGAGLGAGVAGAGAKGALVFTTAKLIALGAVLTTAGVGTVALERSDRSPSATVVQAPPASVARSVPQQLGPPGATSADDEQPPRTPDEPESEPLAEPTAKAAPSAPPKSSPSRQPPTAAVSPSVSALREEASLLDEARTALSRAEHDVARAKIGEARARFPTSQLAPERDALEVRLVSDSGDRPRAARLARAFVDRYPDSPLRPGVEAIVHATEKD